MKWSEIPWDENASPEVKALEFDLQYVESGGEPPQLEVEGDEEVNEKLD